MTEKSNRLRRRVSEYEQATITLLRSECDQLREQIAAKNAEIALLEQRIETSEGAFCRAVERAEKAEREAEALRKDSERFKFYFGRYKIGTVDQWRTAIDAAIAQDGKA